MKRIVAALLALIPFSAHSAIQFETTSISTYADATSVSLYVTRGTAASGVQVKIMTMSGTLTPGVDFQPLNGLIVFPSGVTRIGVSFPLLTAGASRTSSGYFIGKLINAQGEPLGGNTSCQINLNPQTAKWSRDFADDPSLALVRPVPEISSLPQVFSTCVPLFTANMTTRAYTPGTGSIQPRYAASGLTDPIVVDGVTYFKWKGTNGQQITMQSQGGELCLIVAWTSVQSKINKLFIMDHGQPSHDTDCHIDRMITNGGYSSSIFLYENYYYGIFAQQNTSVTNAPVPITVKFTPYASNTRFAGAGLECGPRIVVREYPSQQITSGWTATNEFYGHRDDSYLYTTDHGSGSKTATYTALIPQDGYYEVQEWHPSIEVDNGSVKHSVMHRDGSAVVTMPQTNAAADQWNTIGSYPFLKNNSYTAIISDDFPAFFCVADAIGWRYAHSLANSYATDVKRGEKIYGYAMAFGVPSEIIVDNMNAVKTGSWQTGAASDQYMLNYNYCSQGTGEKQIVFSAQPPTDGLYKIYEWHTAGADRTSRAKHTITYDGGAMVRYMNQKVSGGIFNEFHPTGVPMKRNATYTVTIDNNFSNPAEIATADAIKWLCVNGGYTEKLKKWYVQITPSTPNGVIMAGAEWRDLPIANKRYDTKIVDNYVDEEEGGVIADVGSWTLGCPDGFYALRIMGVDKNDYCLLNPNTPLGTNISTNTYPDNYAPEDIILINVNGTATIPSSFSGEIEVNPAGDTYFVSDARISSTCSILARDKTAAYLTYSIVSKEAGRGFTVKKAASDSWRADKPLVIFYTVKQ